MLLNLPFKIIVIITGVNKADITKSTNVPNKPSKKFRGGNILQLQIVIISNIDKQFSSDESLVDVDSNQSKPNPLNPWGDINVQDIPMDIKYMADSNSCPASHEIEEKMDVQNIYTQIQAQHQIPHLMKIAHHQALIIQF